MKRKTATAPAQRRGISTIALLLCFTTILCLVALSIDLGLLIQRHQQLKTASQAAALAAAVELFSPRLLDEDQDRAELARLTAINFAAANGVNGMALRLGANPLNAVNGDIVLGLVNPPELRGGFLPHQERESLVNAVVVRTRHSQTGFPSAALFLSHLVGYSPADFYAESTAAVDHRIVGFRPVGCSNIPMLPVLVHGDPWTRPLEDDEDDKQPNTNSDEHATQHVAIDRFTVEPRQGAVVPVPDGIPEFRLLIGSGGTGQPGVNPVSDDPNDSGQPIRGPISCSLVNFGHVRGCPAQALFGLDLADLSAHGGQLLLGNRVHFASEFALPELHAALQQIIGKPRIFALGPAMADEEGGGNLSKFAAGVVVESQLAGNSLTISVQPLALNSCTAMVRSGAEPNPWVGKVLLIR